ncbi:MULTISPECIES: hypothetical protein [unclassified Sedimentibacter]|uniref:hypothetical protein n=1 Tax=unclassified Sedimentibacter TaxID=2649220 RepID=UPI0027DEDD1D|nr:hypothetical protein [Sedimentibacter sp. MB35-C1]WMJ75693.1 hypothetical protein RBQ61_08605 [Sedimentibacter sp. MB35-C1]
MKKILITVLILTFALTTVIFAAPGDTNDPIVVLSYLNDRLEDLIEKYRLEDIDEIKEQVEALSEGSGSTETGGSSTLEIVEINEGEKLIAGAGSEIILRGGEATVIGSELGGITNVTLGKDFVSGMDLVPNNLFIIPRDDGRGAYTDSYAIFMVRGTYEVIK